MTTDNRFTMPVPSNTLQAVLVEGVAAVTLAERFLANVDSGHTEDVDVWAAAVFGQTGSEFAERMFRGLVEEATTIDG